MSEWKDEMLEYTGRDRWNAVYTITIGELIDSGVFDWSRPELDWSEAAFDDNQYKRVCDYFVQRFMYREISIEPFLEWAVMLKRKLIYEIMPKYKPLYERMKDSFNPLASEDEYYKNRTIQSEYPETLLSKNSDYITDGRDEEYQRIKETNPLDKLEEYKLKFYPVDVAILDELESMFISMYTANVNACW